MSVPVSVPVAGTTGAAWDVVVVGAGPAGSAAALAACRARPGSSVLLLERATFPRDKVCGDALAPEGVDVLDSLDAGGAVAGYRPVRRLRVETPGGSAVAGAPRRPNLVVPRLVLDARMAAAAAAAGAVLRHERVSTLTEAGGHVLVNGRHRARTVIGADGAHSVVRRHLGLSANPGNALAVAVRGYAAVPPGPPELRIAMLDEGWPAYAWSFPVGDGRANVGFGLLRSRLDGGREALHGPLRRFLDGRHPTGVRAAHLPLSSHRPPPAVGPFLLAGDAASLVNPLTGEGIYYALLSGSLAGEAAVRAPSAAGTCYARALRRALGRHLRHTTVLARAVRHRPLVDAAVSAADSRPVFDALVETGLARGTMPAAVVARVAAAYIRRLGAR